MPKIIILDDIQRIVLALVEVDQDAAAIQEYHRPGSRERLLKRIDETIASLMNLRDKIKALNADSYIEH